MKDIVLTYTGGGIQGSIAGWPARDLTATDVERLKKEGVSVEALVQSGLYEYAQAPTIQHEKHVTEKGKE